LLILAAGSDSGSLLDLQIKLEARGHEVMTASSSGAALAEIGEESPDLIIIDVTTPDFSAPELCRRIRDTSPALPIIVMSPPPSEVDKVVATDVSADGFLTRPFTVDELLERIRAVLRRCALQQTPVATLEIGDFIIQPDLNRVTVMSKEVRLTPKEFDLLTHLLRNPAKVISQRDLLLAVWGPESSEETDYLRVLITRLRRKVEPNPARPRYILTAPGIGYKVDPAGLSNDDVAK
jgi:two-component system KDP operon response regulator KdpE